MGDLAYTTCRSCLCVYGLRRQSCRMCRSQIDIHHFFSTRRVLRGLAGCGYCVECRVSTAPGQRLYLCHGAGTPILPRVLRVARIGVHDGCSTFPLDFADMVCKSLIGISALMREGRCVVYKDDSVDMRRVMMEWPCLAHTFFLLDVVWCSESIRHSRVFFICVMVSASPHHPHHPLTLSP